MSSIFTLSKIIPEFKYSFRLALPLIATELLFALNSFIATAMIAHLGKEELAANALVWNIYIAIILFFIGILFSISIMTSQSFGAKDNEGISTSFKQGLIMAIIFSAPMMLIMWAAPIVLVWAKQDPIVISHAEPFFHSLIWGIPPLCIVFAIEQFLIGITRTRIVMLMSLSAVPIQIFFYYAFLFGKFGLPKTGLDGIGYGVAISHYIITILFIAYLCFAKTLKKYNLFKKWWRIDRKFLSEMFCIGLPLGMMFCSEVFFFVVVAIMMGLLGVTTLAAFQITDQYLMVALVILFALAQTASIRVGFEVGHNNRNKLKLTTMVNIMIGFCLVSIFSILYILFPEKAISIDVDLDSKYYDEVITKALKFFPLMAIFLAIDSIRIVCNGALRGLKDTNYQLLISIVGFWAIAFPLAYLLGFTFNFGGVGIWWGIIIGLFATGIMLLIRFNKIAKTINLTKLVTKR